MSEEPPNPQAAPPVVAIVENRASVTVPTGSGPAVINRIQDTDHEISAIGRKRRGLARNPASSRYGRLTASCRSPALELLAMLGYPGVAGVDRQIPDWFEGGSIPGAVTRLVLARSIRLRPNPGHVFSDP